MHISSSGSGVPPVSVVVYPEPPDSERWKIEWKPNEMTQDQFSQQSQYPAMDGNFE